MRRKVIGGWWECVNINKSYLIFVYFNKNKFSIEGENG